MVSYSKVEKKERPAFSVSLISCQQLLEADDVQCNARGKHSRTANSVCDLVVLFIDLPSCVCLYISQHIYIYIYILCEQVYI